MGQGMAMEVFLVPTSLTSPNLHWAAGSKGTTACIGFMQGFSADRSMNKRVDKLDFIKVKIFCSVKAQSRE